ncbi:MAG: hypothetical protein RBT59_03055 [Arcobacteraceae bacterium]|jgi:hypothetical protein|nr:hypothetical protein [Arcobacteraceae bacterium]
MIKIKKQYFPYVVKDLNLLIVGDDNLANFNEVFHFFHKTFFLEMTPFTIENLSSFILSNNIHIVIVNSLKDKEDIALALEHIIKTQDIKLGLCCLFADKLRNEKLVNMSDVVFTPNATNDDLVSKFYNLLHTTVDSNNGESNPKVQTNTSKGAYRDAFEVDVMLISEELHKAVQKIDEGDISDEVFESIQKNISKVAQIVNGYMMSSDTIKRFIKMFDKFLKNFDKNAVKIENIDGFEYLARLVEDIAIFLDKYFIEKEFDDIYVVEDSLKSSFKFMKDTFEGNQPKEDDSPLEFF